MFTKKAAFDIPESPHQSTAGARRAYQSVWGHEWPHEDDYLRELARQIPKLQQDCFSGSRCEALLMRMRESHPFPGEEFKPIQ